MSWKGQYKPGSMARNPADSVQGASRLDRFDSGAKMLLQAQLRKGVHNSSSGLNYFFPKSLKSIGLNAKLKQYANSSANKVGPDGKVEDWDKGDFNQYWHTQLRGRGKLYQKNGDSLFDPILKAKTLGTVSLASGILGAANDLGISKRGGI